ncbi:MAG: hypothetical protein ACRDOB_27485 [Streptosporangiaceae bacterium]
MQPLAVVALTVGLLMIIGVAATLIRTRHASRPHPARVNRLQRHGTIPLAGAGLALAVVSRSGGQSPATASITFAVALAVLLAALLCALVGAAAAMRHPR